MAHTLSILALIGGVLWLAFVIFMILIALNDSASRAVAPFLLTSFVPPVVIAAFGAHRLRHGRSPIGALIMLAAGGWWLFWAAVLRHADDPRFALVLIPGATAIAATVFGFMPLDPDERAQQR